MNIISDAFATILIVGKQKEKLVGLLGKGRHENNQEKNVRWAKNNKL